MDSLKIINLKLFEEELNVVEKMQNGIEYYQHLIKNIDLDKSNPNNSHIMYAVGKVDKIKENESVIIKDQGFNTPDIDCDLPIEFRQNVIEYLKKRYGKDNVGHIITFNTLDARGAIKEAFRITQNIPFYAELSNDITKVMVDKAKVQDELEDIRVDQPDYNMMHYCIENIGQVKQYSEEYKEEFDIAIKLTDLIKNTGMHAAGIVIADKPLRELFPIVDNEGQNVVAVDMQMCELIGAVKIDLLGVAAYSKIDTIVHMINNALDEPELGEINAGITKGS